MSRANTTRPLKSNWLAVTTISISDNNTKSLLKQLRTEVK